jgi:pimeloyl-ACP methyl ester carboxylesterase
MNRKQVLTARVPQAVAVCFFLLVGAGCRFSQESSGSVAIGAASASQTQAAGLTARIPDAFYDPPADLPGQPGILLRSEPLEHVTLPAGMRGWRILYTTTINDTTSATAVATVFAPVNPPEGPRPVITWEHGTTGVLQKCMPSLVSAPTSGIPALDRVVSAGWVIVATDYSFTEKNGPHPYLIGEGEARAALDSVRAARRMPDLSLDERTVVWGHSQGGHSALWTGIAGPRYAPDVKIVGVAAIAPAANIKNLLEMNPAVAKRLGPYLALSYSRFYPDVKFDQALRPEAIAAAREIVHLCGFLPPEDPKRIAALTTTFEGTALAVDTNAPLALRLAQNTPDKPIAAPLLIAQGLADVVVPPIATDAYVHQRCEAGERLDYWTFAGRDHVRIVQPGTPLEAPLVAWTMARFSNESQGSGCSRASF